MAISPPSSSKLLPVLALVVLLMALAPLRATAKSNVLYSPGTLSSGSSLTYGSYVLAMQGDCNLGLYAGGAVWSSGTFGRGTNCRAVMQSDGNLVMYTGVGQAVWSSNTSLGIGNYVLILQPDRNLVIYGPARWSSQTSTRSATVVPRQCLAGVIAANINRRALDN